MQVCVLHVVPGQAQRPFAALLSSDLNFIQKYTTSGGDLEAALATSHIYIFKLTRPSPDERR